VYAERVVTGSLYSLAQPELLQLGTAFAGAETDVLGNMFKKHAGKKLIPFY